MVHGTRVIDARIQRIDPAPLPQREQHPAPEFGGRTAEQGDEVVGTPIGMLPNDTNTGGSPVSSHDTSSARSPPHSPSAARCSGARSKNPTTGLTAPHSSATPGTIAGS